MSAQLEFDFPPIRSDTLRRAEHLVTVDRAEEHGDMAENFATIADYWSTHLGVGVTGSDVAVMMTLLKLARIKNSTANLDNWIDGCGYLACGAELATRN